MSVWQRIRSIWIRSRQNNTRTYDLDGPLHGAITNLAIQERHTEEEMTANVLTAGINKFRRRDEILRLWHNLSPREKDVTAHTCLGLTNRQIAARMQVSPETVKSYLETVSRKLGVKSKIELRVLFADFGFEAWENTDR